ncbi:hypothetical protein B0H17DRAFT_556838 [Mycena rosella]|uniref:Protein kinase domain-containing protein n=1 Tax=Mycena rosella TaxID=1033263 RepID=A0AAD7FJD9_MYCRO|nr:hypothetical protein B0H17DRAFT_556838 [Mycena rosella]
MGYLNLLRELRLNADTGAIDRHQIPVRRAHSARIHGFESTMTVAVYEGDRAEENWREAIYKHSNLRHPNIIQLFGTSRTSTIHAAIFMMVGPFWWLDQVPETWARIDTCPTNG